MMKNNTNMMLLFLGISGIYSAQVGINVDAPKATLQIEGTSRTTPNGTDGILIPKIKNFPETNPEVKGILVFLQGNEEMIDDPADTSTPKRKIQKYPNNFYFWNGGEWIPFTRSVNKQLDETIYSFNGQGMTGGYFNFSQLVKQAKDSFDIPNNTTIKVGKKGYYLINFFSSIRRTSTGTPPQSNFHYYVEIYNKNGVVQKTYNDFVGFPNAELLMGNSISFGMLHQFEEGDLIRVRGNGTQNQTYTSHGNNNITLTFIHN